MAAIEPKRFQNDNIAQKPEYQRTSRRVKGFCPDIVYSPCDYFDYLYTEILPLASKTDASRIIDRAVVSNDCEDFSRELAQNRLSIEAAVPLGGCWDGYSWTMIGRNDPGRILSDQTKEQIKQLALEAQRQTYEPVKPLPADYSLDCIKGTVTTEQDIQRLVELFGVAFKDYVSPLTDPKYVLSWINDVSTMPFVIRDEHGLIVAVANADLAEMSFINGSTQPFKYVEIGDSATDPKVQKLGLNRIIKAKIISTFQGLGYDSIHTETRASWAAPNFANVKNGMNYFGTLWSNCQITSQFETIPETKDPQLDESARKFGSLNVWAMTQANPHWPKY